MPLAGNLHGHIPSRVQNVPIITYVKTQFSLDKETKSFQRGEIMSGNFNVTFAPGNVGDINEMALACTIHGWGMSSSYNYKPIACTKTTFNFKKKSKVFLPGEIISGNFQVTDVPKNPPEINGLILELEGHLYINDILKDSKEKKKIVGERKYFLGNGTKSLGPLKEGEYKFSFKVPEDCPCTFSSGKGGWIKYRVCCSAHQTTEGMYEFESEEVTIGPRPVSQWKNHKYFIQPMYAQKMVSSFLMAGKIQMWLTTEQKCYAQGNTIRFILRVKNGGGKNVRGMTVQLQQTVNYNTLASKVDQSERILLPEVAQGPGVPLDFTQVWNGELKLPELLQPSIDESESIPTPIHFQYALRVTLQMAGSLVPNINEEFPIQIGCPLENNPSPTNNLEHLHAHHFLTAPEHSGDALMSLGRRMSMISLAPSLPDYDTATALAAGIRFGLPPPSYSCLEINSKTQDTDGYEIRE